MLAVTNSVGLMGCDLCSFSRTAVDSRFDMGFSSVSTDFFVLIQHFARCWDTKMSRSRSGPEQPRGGMERDMKYAAPHSTLTGDRHMLPSWWKGPHHFPAERCRFLLSSHVT